MLVDLARRLCRHAFIRFGLVGAAGYVVDACVLALGINHWGLDPYRGRVLSIAAAMIATWAGNRYFTFAARRARGSLGAIAQEGLKFAGANLVGAAASYGVYAALVAFAPSPFANPFLAQPVSVFGGMIFNFVLSRTLVFTREEAPKADPQKADPQKADPTSPT
jgi:putative flippase GtrA